MIGSGKGQGGDGEDPCSCDGLQKVTRVFERLERVQLLSRDPNSSCMSHLCWHLRTESRIRWHHFGGEITYACALRDCVETNGLPTVQWHPDVAPCCPPQEVDFVVFTMKAPKHLRCGHLQDACTPSPVGIAQQQGIASKKRTSSRRVEKKGLKH